MVTYNMDLEVGRSCGVSKKAPNIDKIPPIPKGFERVDRRNFGAFTIRNIEDGSEFCWIPVEKLPGNGTRNSYSMNQKFGRRCFETEDDSNYQTYTFCDNIPKNCVRMVNESGGFYLSAYVAGRENANIVFKSGYKPLVLKDYKIQHACEGYAKNIDGVKSMVPSGAVYDCLFSFIMTQMNSRDVLENSLKWLSKRNGFTGDKGTSWYGFFDLGKIGEITTEYNNKSIVIRCEKKAIAARSLRRSQCITCDDKRGFRCVLYVEPEKPFKEEEKLRQKLLAYI